MVKFFLKILFLSFLSGFAITSCVHDPVFIDDGTTECDSDTVYFVNDVLPLIQSSCAISGCHDEITQEHDVILTNYKDIIKTADVKARKPEDSELYEVLKEKGDDLMPPKENGGPWDADKIALIKKWIEQGALNNECNSDNCDTSAISFATNVQPIIANNCQGCHNNITSEAYVNLEGYNNIKTVVNNGRFLGAIRHKPSFEPMPKNMDKLNDCDIRTLSLWIEKGMPNN